MSDIWKATLIESPTLQQITDALCGSEPSESQNFLGKRVGKISAQRLLQPWCFSLAEYVRYLLRIRGLGYMKPAQVGAKSARSSSRIVRIQACRSRTMCEMNLNRPATPLNDAHQGGCFICGLSGKGGLR